MDHSIFLLQNIGLKIRTLGLMYVYLEPSFVMHDNVTMSTKFADFSVLNCLSNFLVAFFIHAILLE